MKLIFGIIMPIAVLAVLMRMMYLIRKEFVRAYNEALTRRAFHRERAAAIRRVIWGRAVIPQPGGGSNMAGTEAGASTRPLLSST